jgi:Flp pilus assembly protein TadD
MALIVPLAAALLHGCASGPAPARQPPPETAAAPAPAAKSPAPAPAPQAEGEPVRIDVDAEQRFAAALDLIRHERYEQAQAMLNSITRDHPDLAGPYVNLGIVDVRLGRPAEAERAFRSALDRQPDNAVAYNQLGVIYREQGRFAEARGAYERAIDIDAPMPRPISTWVSCSTCICSSPARRSSTTSAIATWRAIREGRSPSGSPT